MIYTELKRIIDILPYQISNCPQSDAICAKQNGVWRKYNSQECQEIIDKFSLGLLKLGVNRGDKIAIISNNRPEWSFVDLGILQIGAVDVPLYPTISEEEYEPILNEAEVKLIFVSGKEIYEKVNRVRPLVPTLENIYTFDKLEGVSHWSEITDAADYSLSERLQQLKNSIQENDLATIIYTSGTTGGHKGVMLSHKNILSNVKSVRKTMPHSKEHRALSFLPLCHIFERTASYFYMTCGTSIYYSESLESIADDLKEVKPHFFITVPRLLEKVYEKIITKGRALHGVKKMLFFWAVNLGLKYNDSGKNSIFYNLKLTVARKLIFSKWQEALGGNVKGIIVGAAALQVRLARVFNAAGIKVLEGYGLTETSPVLTDNRFEEGEYLLGTAGYAVPDVEIKIAENGEVLARGSNVMMGYYKRPELTSKVLDEDGWFHTGDVGEIIDGKFLKITDRLKEIFKTSGGKYVAPQPIENKLKESFFIEQAMVIGENKKFPAALIVPSFHYVRKWCEIKEIKVDTNEDIVNNPHVYDRIWQEVEEKNKSFGKARQVKKIKLLSKEWSIDTGELTPTMKLKRKFILEKYSVIINEIYEENKSNITV